MCIGLVRRRIVSEVRDRGCGGDEAVVVMALMEVVMAVVMAVVMRGDERGQTECDETRRRDTEAMGGARKR